MKKLAIIVLLIFAVVVAASSAHIITPVANLSALANAITTSNNATNIQRIKTYAQAQAAATQSQEAAIEELQGHIDSLNARVTALEGTPPPDTTKPTPPPGFAASAGQTSVALSWGNSTDNVAVTNYRLYRGATLINSALVNTFTDNGRTCNTAYTYAVEALDAAGNVSTQSTLSTTTTACAPPAAQCADGIDNDGDTKIDLADPGCVNAADNDETDPPPSGGFPNASNTGVPTGTTLTAYTGPANVTTANTVIDSKTIGCIQISAPGVIIRNSRISCSSGYAVYVDDRTSTQTLVTVEDSEIICTGTGGTGVGESDFVVRRTEITKCENGFDINQNALIEDTYVHDLYNGGESHADGAQFASGHWNGSTYVCCGLNITIRHNTIFGMGDNDTTFGTSAIISNGGGDTNILIDNNLLAGGAATIYCEQGATGINYRVTNNHFSTRFKSTVGFYFPSTECSDETQSGNVIDETGQPITLQ